MRSKKNKERTPFRPLVTLEQMLAYKPGRPETYTGVPLVDAVCAKMWCEPVPTPQQVADMLCIERIKLTHALEVLSGHSLAKLRLEVMVKRIVDFKRDDPRMTDTEIAHRLGMSDFGSIWQFYRRNKRKYPELREENEGVAAYVAHALERLIPDSHVNVRHHYNLLPYRGGKAEALACATRLYQHALHVAELTREILERNRYPELEMWSDIIYDNALMHNVGIVFTNRPDLNCHGNKPYEQHGELGANWLKRNKWDIAAYASRVHHIQLDEALREGRRVQLIAYAACFYSIDNPDHRRTVEEVRDHLSQYGSPTLTAFNELHRLFG